MKRSESTKEIATALCAAQSVMRNALKENTNPAFRSKYADLAAYIEASREALAKNGLALSQGVAADGAQVTVTTLLIHKSGEWLENDLTLQAMKQDPQGIGSAISYGRRYSLAAILNMASEDDDGNASSMHDDGNTAQINQRDRKEAAKAPAPKAPAQSTAMAAADKAMQPSSQMAKTTGTNTSASVAGKTNPERYEEACDTICRKMGMTQGNKIIAEIKARFGGEYANATQKIHALEELEQAAKGSP